MRKIFIDAGGFDGDTIKMFRENYPDAEQFEVFCFEPHPDLHPFHEGQDYTFIPKAVWVEDGEMDFYCTENPIGSSLMKNKFGKGYSIDTKPYVKVQTLNFRQWIRENFSQNDFIVVKMDIEGAEYAVIDSLIADGTIHYFNEWFIEWHARKLRDFDVDAYKHFAAFQPHFKYGYMCPDDGKWNRVVDKKCSAP